MPSLDYVDLMKLYARRGIADWHNARHELQTRARDCLGWGIAQDETQAFVTIQTIYNGTNLSRLRFIPMPKQPTKPGIDRCFFLPVRERGPDGQETVAFELFLLVTEKNCLAFRFEPAHSPGSAHGYGHVQLSRTMLRKTIPVTGVPEWLPERYPAFPVAASVPLRGFLCMATAVHGYSTGLVNLLMDIFQSRPIELALYLDELKKILV